MNMLERSLSMVITIQPLHVQDIHVRVINENVLAAMESAPGRRLTSSLSRTSPGEELVMCPEYINLFILADRR